MNGLVPLHRTLGPGTFPHTQLIVLYFIFTKGSDGESCDNMTIQI